MLSYHADADIHTNPFELGLGRLVDLEMEADFIGKEALRRIRDDGIRRQQVGLRIDAPPLAGPNTRFWPVSRDGRTVGQVTSAVHSPRLEQNIALAMVAVESAATGTELEVALPEGPAPARVVDRPFFDPGKSIATT